MIQILLEKKLESTTPSECSERLACGGATTGGLFEITD